jgi:hypothetical protein
MHIQVVPYGKMEAIARSEYGDPMVDMGLRYLEYSVAGQTTPRSRTRTPSTLAAGSRLTTQAEKKIDRIRKDSGT